MYHDPDFPQSRPSDVDRFDESPWSQARVVQQMDFETAALLRVHLSEDFSSSKSWLELSKRLKNKGFYLKTNGTNVHLHDCHSHVDICSCQFLGYPSRQLESRFNQTKH